MIPSGSYSFFGFPNAFQDYPEISCWLQEFLNPLQRSPIIPTVWCYSFKLFLICGVPNGFWDSLNFKLVFGTIISFLWCLRFPMFSGTSRTSLILILLIFPVWAPGTDTLKWVWMTLSRSRSAPPPHRSLFLLQRSPVATRGSSVMTRRRRRLRLAGFCGATVFRWRTRWSRSRCVWCWWTGCWACCTYLMTSLIRIQVSTSFSPETHVEVVDATHVCSMNCVFFPKHNSVGLTTNRILKMFRCCKFG